ncbi:organoarsenical effux MFS transporter ArsJ [Vibrio alginolyticus]|uniref:organoarsenical effux MFS transporter ArsJ n=1 Tax=Vibrio alginolyticus TaxID=663 RepID=UPI0015F5ED9F|nr:organoarsenical effux MFS transporter ArsJ [Vibrio alginolyticus]EGQ9716925.1 organoarsenical effux MFS transporter ArsJ [Vibrio alginolyticus]MCR9311831.1 organoarsenical effux MFS transporter ArsJ [Vibrio alginolyticus]MCR9319055.1 organoarsenical effux MFS transporter ArsJ [Vibrio alginolyticus]MCR9401982.1 organoarsenical effux MFS transporter ArsJ [Vibrio alginolyticus]MCR9465735.1 organoarsenical effux MFS transporter ArsJ [Vibrio alginolyticus]
MISQLSKSIRQYMLVTFNYWNFTVTDGALRMLVVLYFHDLGYSTLAIASLFLFYEFFGVVTNLVGGWLGARLGLNKTMNIGLAMQVFALLMLAVPNAWLTIPWVMAAQALSGIAKDLNKMSAKSAIKTLVPDEQQGALYKWVAILTGSKNALKGAGFFVGGLLLSWVGFQNSMFIMAGVLTLVFVCSMIWLEADMGKAKSKPKFRQIFSKSESINILSAARMFLFGARDVWFVVALPIYLGSVFGWDHLWVGSFLAAWVIAYGFVQGIAPRITGPDGSAALVWAGVLALITAGIAYGVQIGWQPELVIVVGLMIFGAVFAINSSLHSYLIVSYAKGDGVSLDVGFYYMANAMGRLIGTVLSGWIYQEAGLAACLWVSFAFLALTTLISIKLPKADVATA